MRRWVLWFHIHGMLLCASYLVIFGVSSLLFNHPFAWATPKPTVVRWECPIVLEPAPDKMKAAEAVARQLGLMGWVLPWQTKLNADGAMRIALSRPGKEYVIDVPPDGRSARVEERRAGVWQVIRQLHGLMGVRNSSFMLGWAQYTRVCTVFVIFAAFSGIYLFATRKSERVAGWLTLGIAGCTAAAMIIYVTVAG